MQRKTPVITSGAEFSRLPPFKSEKEAIVFRGEPTFQRQKDRVASFDHCVLCAHLLFVPISDCFVAPVGSNEFLAKAFLLHVPGGSVKSFLIVRYG
jgi:hypothetical protein